MIRFILLKQNSKANKKKISLSGAPPVLQIICQFLPRVPGKMTFTYLTSLHLEALGSLLVSLHTIQGSALYLMTLEYLQLPKHDREKAIEEAIGYRRFL